MWAKFKKEFAKQISRITVNYDMDRFETDVGLIIDKVGSSLGPRILQANEVSLTKIENGQLV